MLMKICSCGRRLRQDEQCPCQRESARRAQKKYDREKRDRRRADFYNSPQWRAATAAIRARAFGLDEWKLSEGKLELGQLTHHIEEYETAAELRLSPSNLIYVSSRSHKQIHRAYSRGEESKREMQAKLRRALAFRHKSERTIDKS